MAGNKELGERLRAARTAAGLTLAQVAKYVPCSASQLSNMEAGRRAIFPDVPLAYERAVREATDVNRRGLLTHLAAATIAPAAATELIRHGFTEALKRRPSVDEWRNRLDHYGRDYMLRGAPLVQADLTGDLVVMQQGADVPHMWDVTAKSLAIYGKTTAGPREAIEWYRLASVAAERSGDMDTRVWTAGRAALALGYEGAALPTALRFADEALELTDKPTGGRLNALMGKVHVLALRGQDDEARRLWDEAQRTYDAISPDDTVSDFNYPFWRFGVVASLLFSRIGDEQEADRWQTLSDRHRPSTMERFKTHIELHRGLMMARAGDQAGGVAYAEAALAALPAQKRSQSLTLMLEEIKRKPTTRP